MTGAWRYASRVPLLVGALALIPIAADAGVGEGIFGDGFEGDCGGVLYENTFALEGAWPSPWIELQDSAAFAEVIGGEAVLRPVVSGYSLARMYAAIPTRDVEVRFSLVLEDEPTQGVGFYVRQNGGHLGQTEPAGSGYAVFVEGGFRGSPGIGVWREQNGVEIEVAHSGAAAPAPQQEVAYRVRFRVHQIDAGSSMLQAKLWQADQAEPTAWHVAATDSQLDLQGTAGGIAIDSWSSATSGVLTTSTRVDDIEIVTLCNPIAQAGAMTPVQESFQFTEGPLWRGDHLLFTDIDADAIVRFDPPASVGVFRSPSGRANGLALDPQGRLLAAQHATRSLTRTEADGNIVTLADAFLGQRLNSPNDVVVAADGHVYFTDPDYGLADSADRELPFNGLFRWHEGNLSVEWEGAIGVNQPNGVALSPDHGVLYATDTQAGTLNAWSRAADGSLSKRRVIADGLFIPDGICIDQEGNVYVATWANAIEVFASGGARWGALPVPRAASNCAFGGPNRRTLFVTAHEGLYRAEVPIAGATRFPEGEMP